MQKSDTKERFSGVERVYGDGILDYLRSIQVCIVGIGGVGSWAAEALARCGVGKLVIIDNDDVAVSNINRQIHALSETVGSSKVDLMAERIKSINPTCELRVIDDLLVYNNLSKYLLDSHDFVIDAIDSVRFKTDMIFYCKRNKIPIITTGGAGGMTDPSRIEICDLTRTWNDPLAAKVRSQLRSRYGWTRNPKRRFGVDCIFSSEQSLYPQADGNIGHQKPGVKGLSLDCLMGYGSLAYVTATFGMIAASRVINQSVLRWRNSRI